MADSELSVRGVLGIFGLLLMLVALTIGLSLMDLGSWGLPVAMLLAGIKAVLIALYFMHLRWARPLTWAIVGTGVYIVGILFVLALNDAGTRHWLSPFVGGAP